MQQLDPCRENYNYEKSQKSLNCKFSTKMNLLKDFIRIMKSKGKFTITKFIKINFYIYCTLSLGL